MEHTLSWKFAPNLQFLTLYWEPIAGRYQILIFFFPQQSGKEQLQSCKDLSKLQLYLLNSDVVSSRSEEAFGGLTPDQS